MGMSWWNRRYRMVFGANTSCHLEPCILWYPCLLNEVVPHWSRKKFLDHQPRHDPKCISWQKGRKRERGKERKKERKNGRNGKKDNWHFRTEGKKEGNRSATLARARANGCSWEWDREAKTQAEKGNANSRLSITRATRNPSRTPVPFF